MEKNYQFKIDLLSIHKKDRRDYSLTPTSDEYVIYDGIRLVVPENAGDVIMTAVRDFEDYLFVSMNIASMVTTKDKENEPAIHISLGKNLGKAEGYMGYRIKVEDSGITLEGFDERGVAQGLYYLEDLMNLRCAPFLKKETVERKALFENRYGHPPFGMFEYPDEAFAYMAHLGMDMVDLWLKDPYTTQRDDKIDLNLLCHRAKKYGIDLSVQFSRPHDMTAADPGAQEYYDKMYGELFTVCPDIAKVVLVGECVKFPSKDPNAIRLSETNNFNDNIPTGKPLPGWWPCVDYPAWIDMIKKAVRKHSKTAVICFCTYNWGYAPVEERVKLIENLPDDIVLMPTWDMFQKYEVGNSVHSVVDYSLSAVGPGDYFKTEAEAAKKRGIKLHVNAQSSGRTWDFGVIPFEPMPGQWIKRYEGMIKAHEEWDLCGVLENIHYGFYPSIIAELEKWAFFAPKVNLNEKLGEILKRDYGADNAEQVKSALDRFDEAICHYIPTNEEQYGAFRIGPSYPLWLEPTKRINGEGKMPDRMKARFGNKIYFGEYYPDGGVYFPDDLANSLVGVRIFDEIASNEKLKDYLLEGINILKSCNNQNEEVKKLTGIAEFIYRSVITVLNVKRLFVLKQKLNIAETAENAEAILNDIEALFLAEKENVKATIPIVQADSRLGWEPSMEYTTDEAALRWKLRQLDYNLEYALPNYRKRNLFKI
ncbi:MAG: hypothetical protein IKW59_03675 [Clostridia bacterium]|nr:hypothetical protein [Clostridia bacterium]